MKKLVFLTVLFLGLTSASFGQKKVDKKATDLTEKLNSEITATDKSLALSEDQKTKIINIHIDRIKGLKKLGKSASKEEKKKVNKAHYQKIYKEILTKEQLKARRKTKKLQKEQQ